MFSFITLVLESRAHCYFAPLFIPKVLVSVTFAKITMLAQKIAQVQKQLQNYSYFSQ